MAQVSGALKDPLKRPSLNEEGGGAGIHIRVE